MRNNILHPLGVLFSTTIPLLLLASLFYGNYQIIKSELGENELLFWNDLWGFLGFLSIGSLLYGSICWWQKKQSHLLYGLLAIVLGIAYLAWFCFYFEEGMPASIPTWMVDPSELFFYSFSLVMPMICYGAFISVVHFTPNEEERSVVINFLGSLSMPAFAYLLVSTGILWKIGEVEDTIPIVLTIIGVVLFVFFLLRTLYILMSKKGGAWEQWRLVGLVFIGIIMPILGLALNGGLLLDEAPFYCLFGDFTQSYFYILAIINGILVCIPAFKHPAGRLCLFLARSITFSFIFYFFLLFLPFLPLSIVAIMAVGVGFLMLAPLVLFFVQIIQLADDYQYLKKHFRKPLLFLGMIAGMLILPMILVASFSWERKNLLQAMDYLYYPTYGTAAPNINLPMLQNTLQKVQSEKERDDILFRDNKEHYQPYITPLFRYIVLDNGTLSNQRMKDIQQVFTGTVSSYANRPWMIQPTTGDVHIDSVYVDSEYDAQQQVWRSEVYLELQNTATRNREYQTHFTLPDGAWISDYYLWIENRKEYGLLTDKRAAQWVYKQITSQRRDPGLLFYEKDGSISFQVFPCPANAPRRTGIEIIHKEPFTFQIDHKKLLLGDTLQTPINQVVEIADRGAYIPTAVKEQLPQTTRRPFYYVLVDMTTQQTKSMDAFIASIEQWMKQYNIRYGIDMQLVAVDHQYNLIGAKAIWQQVLRKHKNKTQNRGGFFPERAMRELFYKEIKQPRDGVFPVMLLVTENLSKAAFPNNGMADLQQAFPECPYYYHLSDSNQLDAYSLLIEPKYELKDVAFPPIPQPVHKYQQGGHTQYLPADNAPSIVVTIPQEINKEIGEQAEKSWQAALEMDLYHQQLQLNGQNYDQRWLHLLQNSFKYHLMTPITSFMVVETEAQKQKLLQVQHKILSAGNTKFNVGNEEDDWDNMSEPVWWLVGLLFFIIVIGKKWQGNKRDFSM